MRRLSRPERRDVLRRNLRTELFFFLFVGLLLVAGSSEGIESEEKTSLDGILQRMDRAYQGLTSYRARFEQESETKTFQRKTRSSGKVCFLKPGRMRWSYLEPEPREVYLSGDQIHIYMPDRNQVIEQRFTDAMPGMAPARLFMGIEELAGTFVITLAEPDQQSKDAYCLRLSPKKKETISVDEILLWVGKKNFLPLRTESRDVLGNRTTLVFRESEVNVPLKEELFRFEIPPGAEVMSSPF